MKIDEISKSNADSVYNALCDYLDGVEGNCQKDPDNYIVHFSVATEDLPVICIFKVDAARQLIKLSSPLPFYMNEDKRIEGAIAACIASNMMADGYFNYIADKGNVIFEVTYSIFQSKVEKSLFKHMISLVYSMVDIFNDRFYGLNEGDISLEDFANINT